jgi:hypothetical protein
MPTDTQATLNRIIELIQRPFWDDPAFLLTLMIGVAGLVVSGFGLRYSIRAVREATAAKLAARAAQRAAVTAGRKVKIETARAELEIITKKLGEIKYGLQWDIARSLLADTSGRLYRAKALLSTNSAVSAAVEDALQAVGIGLASLSEVRPNEGETETQGYSVYRSVEGPFLAIANALSTLIGLIENEQFNLGEDDAKP